MTGMIIERVESDDPAIQKALIDPLVAYNIGVAGDHGYKPLALTLRDGSGAIAGGLFAESYYDWMFIKLLVVPDGWRGQGLGTQLMQEAEAVARARGLGGIWLDTFSFQARPFYERLGFTCFATLDGHPRGGARYFMQKRFEEQPPA